MRFRRSFLINLLLFGFSILLFIFCAEVFLRLVKPQNFDVHAPGMYVADPSVGYVLKPGFAGIIERSEFRVPFTVNEAGLRGPTPRPRTENTFRILVLGDSMAFGFGVLDDETFSVQLENMFAGRFPSLDVQVLNGSVPGYGTADELAFLKSRGAALDPDLVVVQFFSINDILESLGPAAEWAAVEDGWLIDRNALKSDTQPEDGWGGYGDFTNLLVWVKDQSHLFNLVSNSLGYIGLRLGLVDQIDTLWGEDFPEDAALLASRRLVEIAEESGRLGADCLFLYTTGQNYVLGAHYAPPRSSKVVGDAAAGGKVPWIDATPFLRDRPDRYEQFRALDGHWTAVGHRAIAELLADRILELGFIDVGAEK